MSLKTVFFVILFLLFLSFSNVTSVDNNPQSRNSSSNSSPNFNSQNHHREEEEQKKRINDQRELENILKIINAKRHREEQIRKQEKPPLDQLMKNQRQQDQTELDNIENKVRKQIQTLLDQYDKRQPLNEEYSQRILACINDYHDFNEVIKRIEERRIQEQRMQELRSLNSLKEQLESRKEHEKKQIALEQSSKNQNYREQRAKELEVFMNLEQKLLNIMQRIQDWHTKNQPLNNFHRQILNELYKNLQDLTSYVNRIDDRRLNERRAHYQQIIQMRDRLDGHRRNELEQRKQQQSPKSEMSYVQRKKDEFIEDRIDGAVRSRINFILKKLEENYPLDNEFEHQKELLNHDWQKLVVHVESVKQRRTQELNTVTQSKQEQNPPVVQQLGNANRYGKQRPK